ncbi:MAG: XRE family transcriptional regulator [Thermomicrobiales bacterium]
MAVVWENKAHQTATRSDLTDVATKLQELFGQKVTAAIAGVSDSRAVGKWARGERVPHPETAQRLREAMLIANLLLEEEPPAIVRAWFVGLNPNLDDRVPALVIGEEPGEVMRAARSFLATG